MKIMAASIVLVAGLLATSSAHAGPCSGEIVTLTQALATYGAGSGPAAPASTLPKAPSSSGSLPADPLEPGQPPKISGANTIPKAPSTAGTLPPNPLESADAGKITDPGTMAGGGEAEATLRRAQELDQAGDEAGCMAEIAKAKTLINSQ